jgi:hypothetical protein
MMELPVFTDSRACRTEAHCRTCRDLDGGRKWRQSRRRAYTIPEDDFPCPLGHPWGYEPPLTAGGCTTCPVLPEAVAAITALCDACPSKLDRKGELVTCEKSRCGQRLKPVDVRHGICPLGYFRRGRLGPRRVG